MIEAVNTVKVSLLYTMPHLAVTLKLWKLYFGMVPTHCHKLMSENQFTNAY